MRNQILGLACLALAILPANAQAVPVLVAIPQVQVLPLNYRVMAAEADLRRLPMTHNELRSNRPTIAAGFRCPWFLRLAELAAFRHTVAASAAAAQKDIIPRRREYDN